MSDFVNNVQHISSKDKFFPLILMSNDCVIYYCNNGIKNYKSNISQNLNKFKKNQTLSNASMAEVDRVETKQYAKDNSLLSNRTILT